MPGSAADSGRAVDGSGRLRNAVHYAPVLLGLGAVVLYTIGVLGTVGSLRASHVDVVRGLELVPLERHLRHGAGVVFSPDVLRAAGIAFVLFLGGLNTLRLERRQAEAEEGATGDEGASSSEPGDFRRRLAGVVAIAVLLLALVVWASPWTTLLYAPLVAATFVAFRLSRARLANRTDARVAGLYVGCMLAGAALAAGLAGYFSADPLPCATITTTASSGRPPTQLRGPLVAQDGALIYVATAPPDVAYGGVAAGQVGAMTVRQVQRPQDPTVLELVGGTRPSPTPRCAR